MKYLPEWNNSNEKAPIHFIPLKYIIKMCQTGEHELSKSTGDYSVLDFFEQRATNDVEVKTTNAEDVELSPVEYVKTKIFPILLPILTKMLEEAAGRECFERERFAFNGLDYITLNLYARNPRRSGTGQINQLGDIPWVAEHWKTNPRTPLPLSWHWTRAEAATVLQSHWRGYLVRRTEEVQEMRQWQKDWRAMKQSSGKATL